MTAPPPHVVDWLEDLCQREHDVILAFCRRRLSHESDAFDACQQTYTVALLNWAKVVACEAPGGWLMETARRVCLESLRRRQRDRTRGPSQPPHSGLNEWHALGRRQGADASTTPSKLEAYMRYQRQLADDATDRNDQMRTAAELVVELPDSLRVVASLALQGRTPREIAEQLDLTETAVNIRLHRARKQLSRLTGP